MNDFASAAMVRILAAGMRQAGLSPPALPHGGAHVALAHKRALVQAAVAQGGIAVLPRLGQGLEAIRGEPVHQALAAARGPQDLLARWMRMERYIHSRHRITAEPARGGFHVTHCSLRPGQPPLPEESLVVLGVLAAALQACGARGVRARIGRATVFPQADAHTLARLARDGRAGSWRLLWQDMAPPPPARPLAPPALDDVGGPPLAQALTRVLLADLLDAPPLADAAQQLNLSPRGLQRALAGAGLSYSRVLLQTRCRAAAWHLVHSRQGLAETGFVCGFADQAHFTRVFRQHTGVTPARYRSDFELLRPHATPFAE